MRTLVITPTYDEAENIEEWLRRTRAAVPDADILVVDGDPSTNIGVLTDPENITVIKGGEIVSGELPV